MICHVQKKKEENTSIFKRHGIKHANERPTMWANNKKERQCFVCLLLLLLLVYPKQFYNYGIKKRVRKMENKIKEKRKSLVYSL